MDKEILQKVFVKSDNVVFRKIADEYVLVPVYKDAVDLEALFSFNETAARMWELIDGKQTAAAIASTVAQEYAAAPDAVARDAADVLSALLELKFIMPVAV